MKKFMLLKGILLFATVSLFSQDAFDSPAFSAAVKKLEADRTRMFAGNKGSLIRTIGSFYSLHRSLIAVPGADSATVSIPLSDGRTYASYFFKTAATLVEAKARMAGLTKALKAVFAGSLQETQRTDTINRFVYYKTCLQKASFANCAEADYDVYAVLYKGSYQVVLRAYGKKGLPAPPPLPPVVADTLTADDPLLEQKITSLLKSMYTNFDSEIGAETVNSTTYYREYIAKTKIWGLTGKIKRRSFETSVYYSADYNVLDGPDQAVRVYEQLKKIFIASGLFRFDPESRDGKRRSLYGRQNSTAANPDFKLVIDCYMLDGAPSAGFLLIKSKSGS